MEEETKKVGKRFAYGRVSTQDQSLLMQTDAFEELGIPKEDIYLEKASGKKSDRPQLEELKKIVREHDILYVYKLDRLSRSLKDLMELASFFKSKGVELVFIRDNIDTTTATGQLLFHLIGAFAQFEADLVSERTTAGLAAARARGRLGGRKAIRKDKIETALDLYDTGKYTINEICKKSNVARATLYKYIKLRDEESK